MFNNPARISRTYFIPNLTEGVTSKGPTPRAQSY